MVWVLSSAVYEVVNFKLLSPGIIQIACCRCVGNDALGVGVLDISAERLDRIVVHDERRVVHGECYLCRVGLVVLTIFQEIIVALVCAACLDAESVFLFRCQRNIRGAVVVVVKTRGGCYLVR